MIKKRNLKKLNIKHKDNAFEVKPFLVFDIKNQYSSQFFDTYDEAADYSIDKGLSTFLEVGEVIYNNSNELALSPINFYFVPKNSSTIYVIDVDDFEEVSKEIMADKVFLPSPSNSLH
ncbi:hypothetical protein CBG25_05650 [Arsenophonus sp. ENCA]|uniref:hypothetical protein n=1 Tax=Arsenophonus sp. ENCA TaxID=1987579 RepID=UPI000BCC6FCC|nr:hypothetical protein [Arsenophonus sp. ENCA]PAV06587.1 hypothetical protein CBG25_05650 [Arsenophonus sp. ENCA]